MTILLLEAFRYIILGVLLTDLAMCMVLIYDVLKYKWYEKMLSEESPIVRTISNWIIKEADYIRNLRG